jgi:hypothetical protein
MLFVFECRVRFLVFKFIRIIKIVIPPILRGRQGKRGAAITLPFSKLREALKAVFKKACITQIGEQDIRVGRPFDVERCQRQPPQPRLGDQSFADIMGAIVKRLRPHRDVPSPRPAKAQNTDIIETIEQESAT